MTLFPSSTQDIPPVGSVPRHIAIIMDGNGRWAKQRFMPRVMGHQRGVEALRGVVRACRELGIRSVAVTAGYMTPAPRASAGVRTGDAR